MSNQDTYFIVPPEDESSSKAPTGRATVIEETIKKQIITQYEDTRIDELVSKVDILTQEVEDLIDAFKEANNTYEKVLSSQRSIIAEEIEKAISRSGDHITEDTVVIRTITREQAKEEIMELLDKSDKLYYYNIAEALSLDLELVVDLIAELESEGVVGEAR